MRIDQTGKDTDTLMGEFNGIPIYDCGSKGPEVIKLKKTTFEIFAGIIDGFLQYGRNAIPIIKDQVNKLITSRNTEVTYRGCSPLGFYKYNIKYGNKEIEFAIEPDLIPIYNYCVNDMARRHQTTPRQSYVSQTANKMTSPLTSIDQAIARIDAAVNKAHDKLQE